MEPRRKQSWGLRRQEGEQRLMPRHQHLLLSLWSLSLCLLLPLCSAEIKELQQPTETVYFSKSTEVVAMGCFSSKDSPEASIFLQAAKGLSGVGGVNYGITTTQAVWSRYLSSDHLPNAPPAIVVWSAFDPETGKIRKGKKSKSLYSGPWEYHEVYKWLVRQSQPLVSRLPNREGPDFQKRQHLAMRSNFAKLVIFDGSGAQVTDGLLGVAQALSSDVLTIFYAVTSEEDDEGSAVMESMGLNPSDVKKGSVAVITRGSELEKFDGDVADAEKLSKFANQFLENNKEEKYVAGEKSKGGTKISKKSKKNKKADL